MEPEPEPAPAQDRGPVAGKLDRRATRKDHGPTVGVTSSLSRHARSRESTWEPCSGSSEEGEGAFSTDVATLRLRHPRIQGRFQPPRGASQVPIPKRRHPRFRLADRVPALCLYRFQALQPRVQARLWRFMSSRTGSTVSYGDSCGKASFL